MVSFFRVWGFGFLNKSHHSFFSYPSTWPYWMLQFTCHNTGIAGQQSERSGGTSQAADGSAAARRHAEQLQAAARRRSLLRSRRRARSLPPQRRYRCRLKLKYRCRMPRSNTHLKPRLWLYSLRDARQACGQGGDARDVRPGREKVAERRRHYIDALDAQRCRHSIDALDAQRRRHSIDALDAQRPTARRLGTQQSPAPTTLC